MFNKKLLITLLMTFMFITSTGFAAEEEKKLPTTAILDFESTAENSANVADLLSAYLTALYPNMEIVEREKTHKILGEAELGLSGLVEQAKAAKIGQLIGAKLIVTGKIMVVDKQMMIVAKVIGTETSKLKAIVVKNDVNGKLDDLIQQLAQKVGDIISKSGIELIAKEEVAKDPVKEITEAVKGLKMPRVRVILPERHIGNEVSDPAARTEILSLLKKIEVTVLEGDDDSLSKWAKKYTEDKSLGLPENLSDTDIIIIGQGISEFAGRFKDLVSCKARVEIEAIDVKTGKLIAIERGTGVAVDVVERIAGKTALQNLTATLAIKLVPDMIKSWNKTLKEKPDNKKVEPEKVKEKQAEEKHSRK